MKLVLLEHDITLTIESLILLFCTRKVPYTVKAWPAMRYMCHLWPYRAVERVTDFKIRSVDVPEVEVLAIAHEMNPTVSFDEQVNTILKMREPGGLTVPAPLLPVAQAALGVRQVLYYSMKNHRFSL